MSRTQAVHPNAIRPSPVVATAEPVPGPPEPLFAPVHANHGEARRLREAERGFASCPMPRREGRSVADPPERSGGGLTLAPASPSLRSAGG